MNKLNIQKFAETTPTLGLSKPAITDKYDINVFNENMDIIDTQITFAQPRTTLWTGDLPGGSSITLEGAKRFLEIYMKIDFEAAQGVMRYVIDTTIGEVNSGAGVQRLLMKMELLQCILVKVIIIILQKYLHIEEQDTLDWLQENIQIETIDRMVILFIE